jgi:hypothetical protein
MPIIRFHRCLASAALLLTCSSRAIAGDAAAPAAASVANQAPVAALAVKAHDTLSTFGDKARLKATVLDGDQRPAANIAVSFRLAGTEVGEATTGADGMAIFEYLVPDTIAAGSHPYEVRVQLQPRAGIPALGPQASANLALVKAKTRMHISAMQEPEKPIAAADGNRLIVGGRLERADGSTILGSRTVSLTMNGKRETAVLRSTDGQFWFGRHLKLEDLGGTVSFELAFDGDAQYLPYYERVERKLTALPRQYGFEFPGWPSQPKVIKLGESVDIPVRTYDNHTGKPIANTKIRVGCNFLILGTIQYLDNLGTAVTDSVGRATVHFTHKYPALKPADCWMGVMFEDGPQIDSVYDQAKKDNMMLRFAETTVHAALTAPSQARPGDMVNVSLQLTAQHNQTPLSLPVNLYKGATVLADGTTNAQGKLSLSFMVTDAIGTGPQSFYIAPRMPKDAGYRMDASGDFSVYIMPKPMGGMSLPGAQTPAITSSSPAKAEQSVRPVGSLPLQPVPPKPLQR